MPWKSSTKREKKRALIGRSSTSKAMYKEIFSPGIRSFFETSYKFKSSAFFKEIDNSDPSDWLLNHKEDGQTYEEFWKSRQSSTSFEFTYATLPLSTKMRKRTICILPIGPFPARSQNDLIDTNPLFNWLKSYCSAFFHTAKVTILQPVPLDVVACDYRVNEFTGRFQLNATQILGYLKRRKTSNQDCLVGVTMIDLFPKESWNFVFGLASTSKSNVGGVGVFSFCRYENSFYQTWSLSEDIVKTREDGSLDYSVFTKHRKPLSESEEGLLLLRACKVMTHEVCHMFGLKHCIWMQCLMNGTNHLQESDRRPPHLCPVCVRKLQSVLNFDILDRYKTLLEWTQGQRWKVQSTEIAVSTTSKKPTGQKTSRRTSKSASLSQYSGNLATSTRKQTDIITSCERPPLEYFSDYKFWIRDAIEFIISNGKKPFLPSTPDDF